MTRIRAETILFDALEKEAFDRPPSYSDSEMEQELVRIYSTTDLSWHNVVNRDILKARAKEELEEAYGWVCVPGDDA